MKILLVSRRYYPDVVGGGQISAHWIARALVSAGHDVRVLTFREGGVRVDETLDGVRIARTPLRTLRWFPRVSNLEWMYREMALGTQQFLKEFRPDIIHALNSESVPSIAFVSRRTGIPFVATINGPTLFCFVQKGNDSRGMNCFGCRGRQRFRETMLTWGKGGLLSKLKALIFWMYSYPHMAVFDRATRQAGMLLPVSTDIRRRLLALGYPENKLRVIPNPIEANKKVKSRIKETLGIPRRHHVLLFAGRITESKGIQQMIRVLPELPDTHVVIAGKGDYIETLRKLGMDLGVADRVHFVGFIANERLGEYYSIADIVIMAGTFYESLGRMLLEACSYGVPVIATDSAGNPDIIEHGKNGYLLRTQNVTELRDRIKDVINNPARAKAMGRAGRIWIAKNCAPAHIATELTAAYATVLASGRNNHNA